jgi:hypothetical protein
MAAGYFYSPAYTGFKKLGFDIPYTRFHYRMKNKKARCD